MSEVNLYNLPKDILVKLVTTIKEDIVKEYEIYKNKWNKIKEMNPNIRECYNCDAISVNGIGNTIYKCHNCGKNFCAKCDEIKCIYHFIHCSECFSHISYDYE